MARACSVCTNKHRADIDKALVANSLPLRDIAGQFGVRKSAVERHKANHLPAIMVKAQEAEDIAHADSLIEQIRDLQSKALGILAKAEKAEDHRSACAAIREARGCLELLAKLQGELDERPQINILAVSSEWLTLRSAIMRALESHPEARSAVVEALNACN